MHEQDPHTNASVPPEISALSSAAILAAFPNPVVVYGSDGVAISANPAAVEMFGFDPVGWRVEQIYQKLAIRYFDGRSLVNNDLPAQRALQGEAVAGERVTFTSAQGKEYVIQAAAAPLWEGDQIRGAVVSWQDITQQVVAERAQMEAQADAEWRAQEVEESHRILEALLEYIPEGINIADAPDVKLRATSRYALEMSHLPGEDAQDLPLEGQLQWWDTYYADGVTPVPAEELPLSRAIRQGDIITNEELAIKRPDGELIHISANAGPIRDQAGQIIGGIIAWRDISERKLVEQEREQQRAFLDAVLRQMPAGIVIVDPTFRILMDNDQMERIWHRPSASAQAISDYHNWHGFGPGDRRYRPEEWPIARALRAGEVVIDEELNVIRSDGTSATMLVSASPIRNSAGQIIAGVVVDIDITDRKQAEHERVWEARLLETIQESVPYAMAYLDRQLRLIRVNSVFVHTLSLPLERLIGHTYQEFLPEHPEITQHLEQVRDTGEPLELREFPYLPRRRPELGTLYFNAMYTPIKNEREQMEGIVMAFQNVTDQVKQRQQVAEAERARAELAEQMNTEINHRMKNNLALLSGILEMQAMNEPPMSKAAVVLRDAITRIAALAVVHENLYEGEPGNVDLRDIVGRIAESAVRALSGEDVELAVDGDRVFVSSKLGSTLAIIANELLTNAIKYGAPGKDGRLRIKINLNCGTDHLLFTVWNSGNPIPTDFDIGQRHGLGLSLVQMVAEAQLHGSFSLRPERGGTLGEVVVATEEIGLACANSRDEAA